MCDSGGLDGLIAHLFSQFLESVIGFLAHQITLFQPSLGPGGGTHPGKAAIASEDLYRFSVFYGSRLIENRGHLVAQEGLWSGNIGDFPAAALAAPAARQQNYTRQQERQKAACVK
jgi:hypothetical protein